jgi:hypothetical protein
MDFVYTEWCGHYNYLIVEWFNHSKNKPQLLLVYRKATDFYMLALYPTSSWVFISYKSFLVESLGFFKYRIVSTGNGDHLTSSFPICILLISFSCFIALAKNLSTMLNESGE